MSARRGRGDWLGGLPPAPRRRCPICLRVTGWDSPDRLFELDVSGGGYRPLQPADDESDESWRTKLLQAYLQCKGGGRAHHLPIGLMDARLTPRHIGLVGGTLTGKTHLLTAMIHQLVGDPMRSTRSGLRIGGLDITLHDRFIRDRVRPMFDEHRELPGTPAGIPINFADALRIDNQRTHRSFAVSFFDVAGERLEQTGADRGFLGAVDGLIFVVDPSMVRGLTSRGGVTGDQSFRVTIQHLEQVRNPDHEPFIPVPAVVVVNKADRLFFRRLGVEDWLRLDHDGEELDLSTVRKESEDVYALLAAHDARAWLEPVERFMDATLHLASATGTDPIREDPGLPGRFPEHLFRPRRVLKPLLTLFSMIGIVHWAQFDPLSEQGHPERGEPEWT